MTAADRSRENIVNCTRDCWVRQNNMARQPCVSEDDTIRGVAEEDRRKVSSVLRKRYRGTSWSLDKVAAPFTSLAGLIYNFGAGILRSFGGGRSGSSEVVSPASTTRKRKRGQNHDRGGNQSWG